MTKDLLVNSFNGISEDELNNLYHKYELLVKEIDWDYDNLVEDNLLKVSYTYKDIFEDFLLALSKIFKNLDIPSFTSKLNDLESSSEIIFWNLIVEYVGQNIDMNNQTSFIRDMNDESFIDVINFVFNRNIIYDNNYISYKNFTADQVKTIVKVLRTIMYNVIEDFQDIQSIKSTYNFGFDFSDFKYGFIFDLISQHKIELMLKNITEKLNEK